MQIESEVNGNINMNTHIYKLKERKLAYFNAEEAKYKPNESHIRSPGRLRSEIELA